MPVDNHSPQGPVSVGPPDLGSKVALLLHQADGLRDRPRVGSAVAVVCLVAAGALWWIGRPTEPTPVELEIPMAAEGAHETSVADGANGDVELNEPPTTESPQPRDVKPQDQTNVAVVHVSGAVRRQGLVTLPASARIADAVAAAGGPADDADPHRLNLAARIVDGQHIRVPAVGEEPIGPLVEGGDHSEAAVVGTAPTRPQVNINSADKTLLETLPGVGPATATAIVQWRNENGRFETVDDLLLVSGIGPAKLDSVRDLVVT